MPRQPKYTVEELQGKIEEYFAGGHRVRKIIVGKGDNQKELELPVLTICDLALYLGFESRQSFYDYEKRDAYSYTVKRARLFIEREYEEQLQMGNPAGAIFALKNFGWTDKQEHELFGKDGGPMESKWTIELVDKTAIERANGAKREIE